ncbi:hypothetical protein [Hydrogenimonas urashimensis]|uniref:hypothetical protein n=1 Tax=Hydrogenimonas urashimensis TaxID=2740515 RepID=UPI001915343B|nr:hypothetical protein [Hydrogenimonas urashimensis]
MKKLAVCVAGILVLGALSSQAGTLKQASATSFSSNGPKIAGWHWLRHRGEKAKWVFACPGGLFGGEVVFCFSTLSTNGVNGGAGHDSTLQVHLGHGARKRLTLKNDCPLLKDLAGAGNSHGIGYPSHGCVKYTVKCTFKSPIVIEVSNEGRGRSMGHTAVKKSSVKMTYVAH